MTINNPLYQNKQVVSQEDVMKMIKNTHLNEMMKDTTITVPLPRFGKEDRNKSSEREFKSIFGVVYYGNDDDCTMTMNTMLDRFKTFVETHNLSKEAATQFFGRLLRGETADAFELRNCFRGMLIDKMWFLFQSVCRDTITPEEANEEIRRIIDDPPAESVGRILLKINSLAFHANAHLPISERVRSSNIQARSDIMRFLQANYSASTYDTIKQRFNKVIQEAKEDELEQIIDTLIQIASSSIAYVPMKNNKKKKVDYVHAIETPSAPRPPKQGSKSLSNLRKTARCFNCNMEPNERSKFNHTTWQDCPFYRDDQNKPIRPDLTKPPCKTCGGFHTPRCQKELRLNKKNPNNQNKGQRNYQYGPKIDYRCNCYQRNQPQGQNQGTGGNAAPLGDGNVRALGYQPGPANNQNQNFQ